VPPSLMSDGRLGDPNASVFWYDGSNIKCFDTTDGGLTWGAAQQIGAVANVTFLAATSQGVHYTTTTSKGNTRFHLYHGNGGWSSTSSDIYWPYTPTSLDAVSGRQADDGAHWESDIIAFTTFFPPMIGLKVRGTEVYNTLTEVQGIAIMRYQNGRWSDHWEFDVVDRAPAFPSRYGLKLSLSGGDWMFMCYERYDGSEVYGHYTTAISRSKTGLEWELPYLLTRNLNDPSVVLEDNGYTYLLNAWKTYRSATCGFTGTPQTTQDITENITRLNVQAGDISQLSLRIGNPEQELDVIAPFANDAVLDAVVELGYKVDGNDLKVQMMIADIDTIDGELALPTDSVMISGRDYLGRLLTVQADQPNEWETQAIGGDNFQAGEDATDYSGLRHTAVQEGFFTAPQGTNSLALAASEAPGIAFSTLVRDAWNGSIQSGIYVQSDDHDDWIGLVFRAYDKNNHLSVRYSIEPDMVALVDRRGGEDTTLAVAVSMGWTEQTWYYLKARFRYNYVWVYASTDGVEWTQLLVKELEGAGSSITWNWTAWTANDIPGVSGRMGYIGYGFSEYTSDDGAPYDAWPPLPDPVPIIPVPEDPVWEGRMIIGTSLGVYYTDDFDSASPTWVAANTGLVTADDKNVSDLKRDPWHWWTTWGVEKTLWITTRTGLWKMEDFPSGTWTQILTRTQLTGDAAATYMLGHMDFSIEVDGRIAVSVFANSSPDSCRCVVVQSGAILNTSSTFTGYCEGPGSAAWAQHSGGTKLIYAHDRDTEGQPFLMLSTNVGGSWTYVANASVGGSFYNRCMWPYVSADSTDQLAYVSERYDAGAGSIIIRSQDGGVTWADISWPEYLYQDILLMDSLNPTRWAFLRKPNVSPTQNCRYTYTGWTPTTKLPDHPTGALGDIYSGMVFWGDTAPTRVVWCSGSASYDIKVYQWQFGDTSWTSKLGNLATVMGVSKGYIRVIDRDTVGAA